MVGTSARIHPTLKKEATKPPAKNFLQQQAKFDRFIECYNHERPHQALSMKYPAELYRASPRPYRGLPQREYPFHDARSRSRATGASVSGMEEFDNVYMRELYDVGHDMALKGFPWLKTPPAFGAESAPARASE